MGRYRYHRFTCEVCGGTGESSRDDAQYCSKDCRDRAYRARKAQQRQYDLALTAARSLATDPGARLLLAKLVNEVAALCPDKQPPLPAAQPGRTWLDDAFKVPEPPKNEFYSLPRKDSARE